MTATSKVELYTAGEDPRFIDSFDTIEEAMFIARTWGDDEYLTSTEADGHYTGKIIVPDEGKPRYESL